MTAKAKGLTAFAIVFAPIAAVAATPHSAPGWLHAAERGFMFTEAGLMVLALLLPFILPTSVLERIREWIVGPVSATRATGIQLLDRRDEVEYDGPATRHYPEGGDR